KIPFKSLRFPKEEMQTWGFHVRRYVKRLNAIYDWPLIRGGENNYLGRFADLEGLKGVAPGLSLQLLPYGAAIFCTSFASDSLGRGGSATGQVGLDAKYGLTGALTLNVAINPDFAQVEVDPEVLNLSAYEVFYPEKRPFFLEGSDIYKSAGPFVY